ncbi:SusC/RagA family TonB-linked outer membrane protein [Pinibacter aurantiacus]|uniref:SusC/RagA family TonB-linked outer membrane protein n=1 Tax=Pinibacter aurantiacus TaxID=2851599 RepID=A0A9E2SF49_9BACT|nr:SusC/RagA family TonB-linked outer membrane protein [Pinibacter aurantiacus]MBV4360193.1 SusC/RagA family TonB-linked outer membrane protein [Pinibacter aurantiacus]
MQLTAHCKGRGVGRSERKHRVLFTTKTKLIMKFTAILLLAACLQVSARGFSQLVSISQKNASLQTVFKEIEKQTGYQFFYKENVLQHASTVTINVKNATLKQALDACFSNQPLTYGIVDKIIVVKNKQQEAPKTEVLTAPEAQQIAEGIRVKGVVKDNTGRPIASVSVVIPGTPLGSMTNASGEYLIDNAPENAQLLFSYIGFESQTINIKGRAVINVTLELAKVAMDEMVVIGYGTTTKRLNTGAVSSIKSTDIAKQTIDNPLTAMQGRMPGVVITQDNGLPGGGVRMQIRGLGSAGAGTIPLYIVDGVPFTLFNGGQPVSDALNAYGTSGANGNISPFSMIAPEDIERIDVLKDADATAIYGSRGANGVVLITTKKGNKGGKTLFNFNVNSGIAKVNHYIPMMNTQQYLTMRRQAFANSGVTPTVSNAKDLLVWDTTAYTDWQKWAIGGTAHTTNATASVSGGNQQNSFLFSTTYRRQGTVFPGDFINNTLSSRLNAGHKSLNGKFSIDAAISYSYMDSKIPPVDLSTFYNMAPNYPIYNSNGKFNFTLENPVADLLKKYSSQTTNFISSVNIAYKILPSLTAKANLGYTITGLEQTKTNPASSQNISATATPDVIAKANKLTYANNTNTNYIVEPQLEYLKNISNGKLQLLAGTTFQQNKSNGVYLSGSGYSSEALITSISSAATVTANYSNYSLYKYNAVFARANYNWEDKYILDGTFRRDGSSRFGPDHRFGNFGAVGAAWVFTKEDFMNKADFLSFGKLRASYGITGNDQISNYLYNALYSSAWSGYSYMGTGTLVQYSPANPELHWESTKKLDIALELSFLRDRISLKTDFYQNRSGNQLLYIYMPSQSGFTSYTGNLNALIQNKGWEFELNTTNILKKDFTWTTSINLTLNRNKLLEFPDLATSSYASTYVIGQPIDVPLLYHFTGIDKASGIPTFLDVNKDGSIGYSDDRLPAKIGTPYFGGITNSFSYKGFTLDFTFQFNHRYGYVNNTLNDYHTSYYPYGYSYYNQSAPIVDSWTPSNPNAKYPAAGVNYSNDISNLAGSDFNWGNTSFVKFKTLSLAYSLPKKWLSRAGISTASIYAQGQNLYTWAKQKYTYDPETTQPGTGSGLGTGTYIAFPQLRTMVLGLNVSF